MTRPEQTLDVRLVDSGRPARIMLVVLLVLMEWSDFAPVDRTVCTVESTWSVGLLVFFDFFAAFADEFYDFFFSFF